MLEQDALRVEALGLTAAPAAERLNVALDQFERALGEAAGFEALEAAVCEPLAALRAAVQSLGA